MRAAVLPLLFLSPAVLAFDTNSDLFTRCPRQRAELAKFENPNSSTCEKTISDVSKCCNLKTCKVQGLNASTTSGNVEGGNLLKAALQAMSMGIGRNIQICDNGTFTADQNCSKDRGASPQDRTRLTQFHNAETALEECLKAEQVIANQQVLQAGGVAAESGMKQGLGDNATEEQILKGLQSK